MTCQCGCGQPTTLASKTDRARGHVKGEPIRFIVGHNNRLRRIRPTIEDRGYETPCWIWTGSCNDRGYAQAWDGPAHRVMWERENGPVPCGMELDHLCRVRACVNPAHLEAVTHAENMRRSALARAGEAPTAMAMLVREFRQTTGLSQSALGRLLGCSQQLVALWERGKGLPTGKHLSVLRRELAEGAGQPQWSEAPA